MTRTRCDMTLMVIWYHLCQFWCQMTLLAPASVSHGVIINDTIPCIRLAIKTAVREKDDWNKNFNPIVKKLKKKTPNIIYLLIANYVPTTSMPFNCHICKLVHVQLCQYICHMNSTQSTLWLETLVYIHFTLFVYAPWQICLPHCVCMFHCTATVVGIWTSPYCIYKWKKHPSATLYLP